MQVPQEVISCFKFYYDFQKDTSFDDYKRELLYRHVFMQAIIWLHEGVAEQIVRDINRNRSNYKNLIDITPFISAKFDAHITKQSFKYNVLAMYLKKDKQTTIDDFDKSFGKKIQQTYQTIVKDTKITSSLISEKELSKIPAMFDIEIPKIYEDYTIFLEIRNIFAHSSRFNKYITLSEKIKPVPQDFKKRLDKYNKLLQGYSLSSILYVIFGTVAFLKAFKEISKEYWRDDSN